MELEFGSIPRKKRSALSQNGHQHKEGWTHTAHLAIESDDSEREHEVAEVLFDLANMFPPPAAPSSKATPRKRDHSATHNGKHYAHNATNGKHPAIPEALSKFAKRCSSHVYIAAFIKHQQELQRGHDMAAQSDSKAADWHAPPDPAAIAAFSAAAAAAAAGGVPTIPPFIAAAAAAAASHPLHSGTPLLVPPPGQLPLAHIPAAPLAPLLTAPGFFFPPGAPAPAFVPGAPSALSIFGPAPFLPPGFPPPALPPHMAAEAAIAASLAPNTVQIQPEAVPMPEQPIKENEVPTSNAVEQAAA